MEKLVPWLYREYGEYVNKKKMLPLMVDGLLPVQRRVLLSLHMMAKTSYVKTAEVLGHTMGHFHPHAAAEGTATYLVQNEFCLGSGQWGTTFGINKIDPAAMRYTKMKASPFIEDMAFKFVNNIKWAEDELKPEPIFLPTMIPICLFAKSDLVSIAFGFKCRIPAYNLKDLIRRLLYLEGRRKTKPTISPTIMGCEILSTKKELEELLTTGTGSISVRGIYEVSKKNYSIIVRGWGPGTRFEAILSRIEKLMLAAGISRDDWIHRDSSNKNNGTKVVFEIDKTRNRDPAFKALVKSMKIALEDRIKYDVIVVNLKGELARPSIDEMLSNTFKHWKFAFNNNTEERITNTIVLINEMMLIKKIRPYISMASKEPTVDGMITRLSTKSGVSEEDVKIVVDKYKIKKILTVDTDTKEYKDKIKRLKAVLSNIDKLSLDTYEELLASK